MVNIYVLELENNKYYIGKTNSLELRLDSHFNGRGCKWTTKYKPIKLIELIYDCDDFER